MVLSEGNLYAKCETACGRVVAHVNATLYLWLIALIVADGEEVRCCCRQVKVCFHKTNRNGIAHCQGFQLEIVGILDKTTINIAVRAYVGDCRDGVAGMIGRPTVEDDG